MAAASGTGFVQIQVAEATELRNKEAAEFHDTPRYMERPVRRRPPPSGPPIPPRERWRGRGGGGLVFAALRRSAMAPS